MAMDMDSARAVARAHAPLRVAGGRPQASALDVLVSLTVADLRVRYGRGARRLLKWLLDPFALVGVYLLLVTIVLHVGGRAPGLSLACAVVPFQLLMSTVINAMVAVTTRRTIILNMAFKRVLIPASSVLTETVAFAASLTLIVLMMGIYRVEPTASIAWLPLVLAANVFLALGLAYPASLFGLWFRDLRNFGISFVRTLFFLAPGLVPLSQIPGRAHDWLRLNPLTGLFESYRDVLLFGHAPAVWELLYPAGCACVLLLLFVPLYNHEQRQFAKVVE
jgi:ABC-type polysaccharide/polyol phosphate export permease